MKLSDRKHEMRPYAKSIALGLMILLATVQVGVFTQSEVSAQVLVSATPATINLSSPTPLPVLPQETTATPTRTPTPLGPVVLEAISEANVRAEADVEAERLGTIRAGEIYPVIARYFRWYQFQFPTSPTGTGWVFDELVTITGDINAVPDLSDQALPTTDPLIAAATQTQEALLQLPGGAQTATAEARIIELPGPGTVAPANTAPLASTSGDGSVPTGDTGLVALPTFTYPPDVVAIAPTNSDPAALQPTELPESLPISVENGIPPLLPILILGGLGIVGLIASAGRR